MFTSSRRLHPARQTQTAESIIEYLIEFQGGGGVVSYFDAGRQAVENPVPPQDRLRLRRYKHARLRVAKYIVLLQNTCIRTRENYDFVYSSMGYNAFSPFFLIHYICIRGLLNFHCTFYNDQSAYIIIIESLIFKLEYLSLIICIVF